MATVTEIASGADDLIDARQHNGTLGILISLHRVHGVRDVRPKASHAYSTHACMWRRMRITKPHGHDHVGYDSLPFADGHTASNAPDLFRTPKLSGAGPG